MSKPITSKKLYEEGEVIRDPWTTLISAVVLRAVQDLQSIDQKVEREAMFFLLDDGLAYADSLDVNIKEIFYQHITERFDVTKLYKPTVRREN